MLVIGYKYYYSKVLCFIMNATIGSIWLKNLYKACYWANNGGKTANYIPSPKVLNQYFGLIRMVDAHNLARQGKAL